MATSNSGGGGNPLSRNQLAKKKRADKLASETPPLTLSREDFNYALETLELCQRALEGLDRFDFELESSDFSDQAMASHRLRYLACLGNLFYRVLLPFLKVIVIDRLVDPASVAVVKFARALELYMGSEASKTLNNEAKFVAVLELVHKGLKVRNTYQVELASVFLAYLSQNNASIELHPVYSSFEGQIAELTQQHLWFFNEFSMWGEHKRGRPRRSKKTVMFLLWRWLNHISLLASFLKINKMKIKQIYLDVLARVVEPHLEEEYEKAGKQYVNYVLGSTQSQATSNREILLHANLDIPIQKRGEKRKANQNENVENVENFENIENFDVEGDDDDDDDEVLDNLIQGVFNQVKKQRVNDDEHFAPLAHGAQTASLPVSPETIGSGSSGASEPSVCNSPITVLNDLEDL